MCIEGEVVAGADEPLSWTALEVGDQTWKEWLTRREFVVRLHDGSEVTIDVRQDGLELHPERTERGTWRDLEGLAAARAFLDRAPAPRVRAALRSAAVREGDRVLVLGRELPPRQEGGGPRDAARSRARAGIDGDHRRGHAE